jgi:hypothetical protein
MRKSILGFIIIITITIIAVAVITGRSWFLLNNISKFAGKFVKVVNIALIKPTFTAAATGGHFTSSTSSILIYHHTHKRILHQT